MLQRPALCGVSVQMIAMHWSKDPFCALTVERSDNENFDDAILISLNNLQKLGRAWFKKAWAKCALDQKIPLHFCVVRKENQFYQS